MYVYFSQNKKIQRTKFDVSQKPLIQKMHTEPEILNSGFGGVICHSDSQIYCEFAFNLRVDFGRIFFDLFLKASDLRRYFKDIS